MILDADDLYMKIIALNEIYNLVLRFSFEVVKMLKKIKQSFSSILITCKRCRLGKKYRSYMVSNKDTFYIKVVALDGMYKFIVLSFCI